MNKRNPGYLIYSMSTCFLIESSWQTCKGFFALSFFFQVKKLAKRGEVPCSRSHNLKLAGIVLRVSKACFVVKLDTLYSFSKPQVFMIPCLSSSIKYSPVNPTALSPSAMPMSLILYNTNKLSRKGNIVQEVPHPCQKMRTTAVTYHGLRLSLIFSEGIRGREPDGEIPTPLCCEHRMQFQQQFIGYSAHNSNPSQYQQGL